MQQEPVPTGSLSLCHHRIAMSEFPVLPYEPQAPTLADLEAMAGPVLIEFGTDWCGHCQAAQPLIAQALAARPALRRLKIEDGRGRALGRSFGVKLWPTLILLERGQELGRAVRPQSLAELQKLLALARS